MIFQNPMGLFGLLTLPLILGLHLFFERKQQVEISSLFLWRFLDKKASGRKARRINPNWLLVLDLLVAAVITLALSQPDLKTPARFGLQSQVVILIDTSTSMLSIDETPSRFTAAKEDILEMIDGFDRKTSILAIAIGREIKLIGNTSEISRQSLTSQLTDLAAGGSVIQLRSGLGLAESLVDLELPIEVHIFTDGAFSMDDGWDYALPITWHFYGDRWSNQAVSNLKLLPISGGVSQIQLNLLNNSDAESSHRLRVIADGVEVHTTNVELRPNSSQPYAFNLNTAVRYVKVELSGSDPLPEDNFAGIGYWPEEPVGTALVSADPQALERALRSVSDLELTVIAPGEFYDGTNFDLTVFDNFLPEAWPAGTVAVFNPPQESKLLQVRGMHLIEDYLEVNVDPITEDLDFSGVRWQESRAIQNWQSEFVPLITAGDIPLMLKTELPEGELLVFLPQISAGNLTEHPSFPMLVSNIVETARNIDSEQAYHIGETILIPEGSDREIYSLVNPAGISRELVVGQEVTLSQYGRHTLTTGRGVSSADEKYFGVNAGEPEESDLRPRSWTEEAADQDVDLLDVQQQVIDLTPWLLGLAVILLILEAWRAWR